MTDGKGRKNVRKKQPASLEREIERTVYSFDANEAARVVYTERLNF